MNKLVTFLELPVNALLRGAIFLLLLVLLVFGVSFTKFSLGGALYINDLILATVTAIAFLVNPNAKIPLGFFLFSLASLLYFILSFVTAGKTPTVMYFRQFMICGYFIEALIIFTSLFQQRKNLILY